MLHSLSVATFRAAFWRNSTWHSSKITSWNCRRRFSHATSCFMKRAGVRWTSWWNTFCTIVLPKNYHPGEFEFQVRGHALINSIKGLLRRIPNNKFNLHFIQIGLQSRKIKHFCQLVIQVFIPQPDTWKKVNIHNGRYHINYADRVSHNSKLIKNFPRIMNYCSFTVKIKLAQIERVRRIYTERN